jgi:hypothetical protein
MECAAMAEYAENNPRYDWSRLNHLQIGKYAEYFTKMECTLYGLDVYSAEVDDKGIDFVIRGSSQRYYDIQVKSSRGLNYIFFPKSKFTLRDNLFAAVILFMPFKAPQLFLIPATAWLSPNACLVSRDYEGLRSLPEWGLNISARTYPILAQYVFDDVVTTL